MLVRIGQFTISKPYADKWKNFFCRHSSTIDLTSHTVPSVAESGLQGNRLRTWAQKIKVGLAANLQKKNRNKFI